MRDAGAIRWSASAASLAMLFLLFASGSAAGASQQPPGRFELRGSRLLARFTVVRSRLGGIEVRDLAGGASLSSGEAFSLKLRDGRVLAASQMKLIAVPKSEVVAPVAGASRAAERVTGRRFCADLAMQDGSLTARWCATLRRGANYLRQEVTLKAGARPVDVAEVRMFDFAAPGARVVGKVTGSPLVAGDFFFRV